MQTVERLSPNALPIMDEIDRIYAYTSSVDRRKRIVSVTLDSSFRKLMCEFNERSPYLWACSFIGREWEKIDIPSNNNLILTFSGGKDSIATAIQYKKMGYNVYLYHMRHINPSFADEWEVAKEAAKLLDLPIYIDDIRLHGHHMWMEHPMKNMLIANGALSYGIREGIGTRLAFGNYTSSVLDANPFNKCAGDCVDMWEAYSEIIRQQIDGFSVMSCVTNMTETLDIISEYPELLEVSLSCLCRHSLRDYRKQWVHDKFGVNLQGKRCGSCYKCAIEYIYLVDHDKQQFNEEYYKYCINQLYKVSIDEESRAPTMYDLWVSCFDYPMNQSKMYETLNRSVPLLNGIRWI